MNPLRFLFEKKQASFVSAYALQESVLRLRGAVEKQSWLPAAKEGVCGSVSEGEVKLYRVNPPFHNSFMALFYGQFRSINGAAVLEGYFSVSPIIKAFMGLWFGLLFVMGTVSIVIVSFMSLSPAISSAPVLGRVAMFVAPILMFCLGIGFVNFSKWLSRDDEGRISQVISSALGAEKRSYSGS